MIKTVFKKNKKQNKAENQLFNHILIASYTNNITKSTV